MDAAKTLGYQPNQAARALMTGRTGLLGFWMCLQYSRYRSQVLDHLRTLLGKTDLAMAVTDVDEEYHWDRSFSRALRVPVDGIIAFDTSASIEAFVNDYDRLAPHTPFVSMGAYWSDKKSFVGIDLRHGAEEAMDYLFSIGRKQVVYLAPSDSGLVTEGARYDAYVAKMISVGLEPRALAIPQNPLSALEAVLAEVFQSSCRPEALLCMNDDLAILTAFALQQIEITPGRDVSIVGFDGIQEIAHCPWPISTVAQPVDQMCTLAVEFLREQIDNPTAPVKQQVLRPHLVVRA